MIYIISYDLNKSDQEYKELYKVIESYPEWAHIMKSVYLVETNDDSESIFNNLSSCIDDNDHIFIARLQGNWHARLKSSTLKWIQDKSF